tara:strand:+ start:1205 stop:1960 length:756 start_codon:yes stop_codon:yes gene_type:complete
VANIYFAFTDEKLMEVPELHPEPIINTVPEWYKNIPNKIFKTLDNENDFLTSSRVSTIKTCPSFVDIFKEGYVIKAPQDYLFYYDDETDDYKWQSSTQYDTGTEHSVGRFNQVSIHSNNQMVDYLPSNSGIKFVFKIILPVNVFTDEGYSTRIIPIPYSFNQDWSSSYGVFKTDYIHQLNIQLQIKTVKKEILIKQGTPLCVVIPFKRETFTHKIVDLNKDKKLLKKLNRSRVLFDGKFSKQYYINKWHKK